MANSCSTFSGVAMYYIYISPSREGEGFSSGRMLPETSCLEIMVFIKYGASNGTCFLQCWEGGLDHKDYQRFVETVQVLSTSTT